VFEVGDIITLNVKSIESALEGHVKLTYFDFTHLPVNDANFSLVSFETLSYLTDSLDNSVLVINCGFDEQLLFVCVLIFSWIFSFRSIVSISSD
jgi:hypothetical protein